MSNEFSPHDEKACDNGSMWFHIQRREKQNKTKQKNQTHTHTHTHTHTLLIVFSHTWSHLPKSVM